MALSLSLCSAHHLPPRTQIGELVASTSGRLLHCNPIDSLRSGTWVKLICGASFEDVVDVRNLSLVYTLAGVDCIDCAADASVVNAVNEGIDVARSIASIRRPWVMISVNDNKNDLHFRKAEFDPEDCPPDCLRPCERVCPANAISLQSVAASISSPLGKLEGGVITERCYGCGRCLPVCPYDKIRAATYIRDAESTSELLERKDVDAIEIHTSGRHRELFEDLWSSLGDSIQHLNLVAVSLPDIGESTALSMRMMFTAMEPSLRCFNLWQLDGRPMSGDIGRGSTKDVISFAVRLASSGNLPQGFLQLAGGTNVHTVEYLKKEGLFCASIHPGPGSVKGIPLSPMAGTSQAFIGGIAYGGYARKIVGRVLRLLPAEHGNAHIEDYPNFLLLALQEALNLVGPVKSYELPFG